MTQPSDKWDSLLSGQSPDAGQETTLSEAASDLHDLLEARPQALDQLVKILSRRLDRQVDSDTFQHLRVSLTSHLGEDPANLLVWVSQVEAPGNRLEQLEKVASPEVMAFLRMITALYGPELEAAYSLWNEPPETWRFVYRDVFYDKINQRHYFRLRIEKFNGESLAIEGDADSILGLTSSFIDALNLVDPADSFNTDRVRDFVDIAGGLLKRLNSRRGRGRSSATGVA